MVFAHLTLILLCMVCCIFLYLYLFFFFYVSLLLFFFFFFFSSRRRHTRYIGDWSSDVCSSDLPKLASNALSAFQTQFLAKPQNMLSYLELTLKALSRVLKSQGQNRPAARSEERRVGKECRSRWSRDQ